MRDSVDLMTNSESTCATPVSPVQIDVSVLRKPLFSRSERLRYAALAALSLCIHIAVLVPLDQRPEASQVEEAIPVGVIIEPPPEEPPQQPEPEKAEEPPEQQPAQKIEEKEATDFARAADQDVEDGKASEQSKGETQAREDIRRDSEAT